MKSKDSLIILEISRVTSRDKQETSLWGNLILHFIITKMYLASVKNAQVTDSRQEVQLHSTVQDFDKRPLKKTEWSHCLSSALGGETTFFRPCTEGLFFFFQERQTISFSIDLPD